MRRNQFLMEKPDVSGPCALCGSYGLVRAEKQTNYAALQKSGRAYAAASAIAISFVTVFPLRAVFGTPIFLSNMVASFDGPKPCGVWR